MRRVTDKEEGGLWTNNSSTYSVSEGKSALCGEGSIICIIYKPVMSDAFRSCFRDERERFKTMRTSGI